MNDDTSQIGKTRLFELAVALRSIGKASSVDRMRELHRMDSSLAASMEKVIEILPLASGRMLVDLLDEEGMDHHPLRVQVWDPRSLRQAADAVEKVAESAPDSVHSSFHLLPESRWPQEQIKKLGLFLLGLRLRGMESVKASGGRGIVSDVELTTHGLDGLFQALSNWHRTFATSASVDHQLPDAVGSAMPADLPMLHSPPSVSLGGDQLARLSEFLRMTDGGLSDQDRTLFRGKVVASVHLFSRLLQIPFAARFFRGLTFSPLSCGSSFSFPSTVFLSPDASILDIVRSLAMAMDASFSPADRTFQSAGGGPLQAFAESVAKVHGRPPAVAFHDFIVQYLRIIWDQQGLASFSPQPSDLDRRWVKRFALVFLDVLLSEQRQTLRRWTENASSSRIDGLLTSGAGAAGVAVFPWIMPRVAR